MTFNLYWTAHKCILLSEKSGDDVKYKRLLKRECNDLKSINMPYWIETITISTCENWILLYHNIRLQQYVLENVGEDHFLHHFVASALTLKLFNRWQDHFSKLWNHGCGLFLSLKSLSGIKFQRRISFSENNYRKFDTLSLCYFQ